MSRRTLSGRDPIVTGWKEIKSAPSTVKSVISFPGAEHETYFVLVD